MFISRYCTYNIRFRENGDIKRIKFKDRYQTRQDYSRFRTILLDPWTDGELNARTYTGIDSGTDLGLD